MISSKLRIGESCTYEVTLPRTQHSRILHQSASSTSTPPPDSPPLTLTQEMCLEILEHAASTPWVPMEHTSSNQVTPEDRLQRAFGRGFQILKFLGRLQDEEVGGQFLDVSLFSFFLFDHANTRWNRISRKRRWRQEAILHARELLSPSSSTLLSEIFTLFHYPRLSAQNTAKCSTYLARLFPCMMLLGHRRSLG